MSGQAAAVVASTDNSGEHNTNFQHQSPSTNDHERNESTARDHSAATQNPASHGNLVVASSAQPAARLAQEALGLSPISSAMPSTSSEAIDVAGGLSTQSAQRKEADEADNLMSTEDPNAGQSGGFNTQGSTGAADDEDTLTLSGRKCLRDSAYHMDLKKLIKEHVNNPAVTDPEDQTMNLADALLPFYQSRTRPPAQKPYTPTHVDLETMILPILNNTWMLPDNKRMSIFRTIDDWYGCLTYTPILGASNSEIDSAVVLSELTQSPTIPGKPDAAAIFLEKRLGEPTVPTERPAKRPRMDSFESPTALQPQVAAPVVSPDRSFSQDQSQDFSHSQSASEPTQKVYCLEEHCNTRISGRSDINGMRIHYAQSHFATGVFLCPVPGCHEGFERKDRYFRKNGHFCQKHGYSPNDGVSWDELVRKLVPTEITDVFHDKCPVCEKKESFETYKEYAKHRDKHLEREIPNHPYHDRCSERAIHHWRQSRCIPEEYRREIDAKKKPGKSCADPVLSTHKDQDNNGNGPSGPSGPGSYSSDGFPNPAGSASQGSRDPNTSSDSNNHGGSYSSPYSARTSTAIFTPISSNLHSSSRILSEGENRRTAAPGINLIKKCFKSIRKLGRGGFGSVDEVICKSTNKSYARKIIPLDQTTTKVSTEVEILKHLRHQHIINLAAYCTTPDQLWMFMTPVAENDLATYLRGDASCGITLPDRELLRTWESCLASALEYLHINGLVHGDIKPQNILVSSDLNIYLADFGSARTYVESSHGTDARPASALTPKYSAPEVSYYKSIGYNWEMGAAADIFSLGCVWAEMETVYTGLSIQVFETFRSGDSAYNSFQANLPKTYAWLDFLWVLQESVLQTSRDWTYAPSSLKIAKDMLSFDPHQRPNVDLVTTVFHCTCSSDSPVMWYPDLPYYRPSSTSLAEVSSHCVADGLSPAKQINMTLNIKPLNYWNATTEGFSSNGRIDGFYDWGTNTPTKCYSFWQVARATSAAPVYFGTKTNDCGPFSDLPKFQVLDGDANMFDIVIGEDLLQSKNRQLEKLLKKPSSEDSRPMHVKDLAKFQCAQQYRNIPTSLDFHQSYPSESTREFCTLSDYLLETSPPSSVEDIYKLWDSVFSLLSCMEKAMDDLSRRTRLSSHQDIEPENIFICRSETTSPYEWQFKLSDLGLSHFKSAKNESLEEDVVDQHSAPDTHGTRTYGAPECLRPNDTLESSRIRLSKNVDMWSMGCILSEVGSWAIHGWERNKSNHSKQRSQSDFSPQRSKSAIETGEYESWLREKARNSKQDLLEALVDEPDSLTKSIAESVIAPMLEPPDKQPSWKWLREKAQTLLDDTRDTLNGYKKTVAKAASPILSLVRSKIKSTCISSTLATDGSRSDRAEVIVLDDPDESEMVEDEHNKDADIDPNISADGSGYSYSLERYLRDKSDCRYLFPGRGCDKIKELDSIYVRNVIKRFERMFITAE